MDSDRIPHWYEFFSFFSFLIPVFFLTFCRDAGWGSPFSTHLLCVPGFRPRIDDDELPDFDGGLYFVTPSFFCCSEKRPGRVAALFLT